MTCKRCPREDLHYHIVSEIRCPKCGAPTMTNDEETWRCCMMFDDNRLTPVAMKPGLAPIKHCDYGEWLIAEEPA